METRYWEGERARWIKRNPNINKSTEIKISILWYLSRAISSSLVCNLEISISSVKDEKNTLEKKVQLNSVAYLQHDLQMC